MPIRFYVYSVVSIGCGNLEELTVDGMMDMAAHYCFHDAVLISILLFLFVFSRCVSFEAVSREKDTCDMYSVYLCFYLVSSGHCNYALAWSFLLLKNLSAFVF